MPTFDPETSKTTLHAPNLRATLGQLVCERLAVDPEEHSDFDQALDDILLAVLNAATLVDMKDAAGILGITRQRMTQLVYDSSRTTPTPEPIMSIGPKRLWLAEEIVRFGEDRQPARDTLAKRLQS